MQVPRAGLPGSLALCIFTVSITSRVHDHVSSCVSSISVDLLLNIEYLSAGFTDLWSTWVVSVTLINNGLDAHTDRK